MEILLEVIIEGILENKRIPKWVRCLLIVFAMGFVTAISIAVGIGSSFLMGKILCWLIAILAIMLGIYSISKVCRS